MAMYFRHIASHCITRFRTFNHFGAFKIQYLVRIHVYKGFSNLPEDIPEVIHVPSRHPVPVQLVDSLRTPRSVLARNGSRETWENLEENLEENVTT